MRSLSILHAASLQPVPELADAIREMRWLLSKNFETERLQSPTRSPSFFAMTRFLEAESFARVHRGDARFARLFCKLIGTVVQLPPWDGVSMLMHTHAWRVALDMVKENTRDASIALHASKAFWFCLKYQPADLCAIVEAGAIPIFLRVVKSRGTESKERECTAYAAALLKLLRGFV
jgi:hypothetical protein